MCVNLLTRKHFDFFNMEWLNYATLLMIALLSIGVRGDSDDTCDEICGIVDISCSSSQDRSCGIKSDGTLWCSCSTKTWIIVVAVVVGVVVIGCIVAGFVLACYCGGVCCFKRRSDGNPPVAGKPMDAPENAAAEGSPVDVEGAPAAVAPTEPTLD